LIAIGTECKKRWKSVRDHYRREKKEGKGTGKAAKKKRAVYWDCLRFLDVVEDERDSFSNISEHEVTGVGDKEDKVVEECVSTEQESDQSTLPITSVHTPTEHTQMSSSLKTSSDDFKIPKSNKRKENAFINKYLKEKKEDRDNFKKCLEELTTPEPEEDATDMFFKTVAATVKKFRPDLATKTKAKIFQITTEMELLNQQSLNTGFTNIIHSDSENSYHSSAASSSCTTPYTFTPADTDSETSNFSSHIISDAMKGILDDEDL